MRVGRRRHGSADSGISSGARRAGCRRGCRGGGSGGRRGGGSGGRRGGGSGGCRGGGSGGCRSGLGPHQTGGHQRRQVTGERKLLRQRHGKERHVRHIHLARRDQVLRGRRWCGRSGRGSGRSRRLRKSDRRGCGWRRRGGGSGGGSLSTAEHRGEALYELRRQGRIGCELLEERQTRHGRGRCGGAGGAAGSAAAVALSPSARPAAPAAAIMLVASILLVNFMVLPIRCRHACARSYRVTGVTQVTRVVVIQPLRM